MDNGISAGHTQHPLHYSFAQAFGERGADHEAVVHDADMISAVQFSPKGDAIATGDKGGRIVILQKVEGGSRARRYHRKKRTHKTPHISPRSLSGSQPDEEATAVEPPEFRFWTQFQSHESEFDYLKSMEIEEKINEIQWCRQINGAYRLLSTNDKTIKLWRVSEGSVRSISEYAVDLYKANRPYTHPHSNTIANGKARGPRQLEIPRMLNQGQSITATSRRTFANAHMFHINSLSISSDDVIFLTADDLRINLWNIELGGPGLGVLDIKPENMEDLTEVLTAAVFHPRLCHIFMYSTSRGTVKLCDLRESAFCNGWVREFEDMYKEESAQSRFSEIVASISDVQFSPCGRYILTRDYLHLRVWDIAMEREPILTVPVEASIALRLRDLYDQECVFDKFQCCFSCDGGSLVTGSYNSLLRSFSKDTGDSFSASASVDFVSGAASRRSYPSEELGQLRKDCLTVLYL
mmetsp:Transcript_8243/g.16703  ORF Transcript_8243/g.16703 Transcript_8243/m.16703 type:complete len:466 (+) Transcript_8243:206-1603(+)